MESGFKRKNNGRSFHSRKRFKDEGSLCQLDKDTYQYFSRISQVLKGNVDKEELEILATNTLKQTEGIELDVCRHTVAASVLEKIIPYAPWSEVQRIIDSVNKTPDRTKGSCESRVEEAFIKDAGRRIRLSQCDEKENCLKYIINFSTSLLENFDKHIWDLNKNFAARTCLLVCSGFEVKCEKKEIISKSIVLEFKKTLMHWSELAESYYQDIISGFLQILLKSLSAVSEKECNEFSKFLFVNCFEKNCEDSILSQFENTSWSRLLETIIEVSPPVLQEEIYQKLFVNQIDALVLSKKGQFPLCKLIKSSTHKPMFENILEKLKDNFSDALSSNNLNILHALSEACINTGHKQGDFVKYLANATGCTGPIKEKSLLICLISMKNVNEVDPVEFNINFHGSLITQNLLKFKKPQKLADALLSLNISSLKRIFTDPKGSFLADAFMTSATVGAKAKERLMQTLKEHYSDLAMDKYGSRTFDVIWAVANLKIRKQILSEMTRRVMKTRYGSIIAAKTGLDLFIKDKIAWEKTYNSSNKTDLLNDIVKP